MPEMEPWQVSAKFHSMKPLISLLLSLVFATTLFAQREEVTVELELPPTLVSAERPPLPDYPERRRTRGFRGSVTVDVTLDEGGKVTKPGSRFQVKSSRFKKLKNHPSLPPPRPSATPPSGRRGAGNAIEIA